MLRLILAFSLEYRDLTTLDPDGDKGAFKGCTGLLQKKNWYGEELLLSIHGPVRTDAWGDVIDDND